VVPLDRPARRCRVLVEAGPKDDLDAALCEALAP
jgi:hypothetical protein